jgi:ABC-2 type transport system ATP-binding protein
VRRFGDLEAVAGVDLEIAPGEIYGFLGPNGAGKSTCTRMLCTLLAPTSGRAAVAGFDVTTQAHDVRLRIGAALQEAALDPKQTGWEILLLQARLYGLARGEARHRVRTLAERLDIADFLDRRVATYSGGMKRRLDLAAALVHGPVVLFLDEPTTGLDPVSRAHVWEEVRRLNAEQGMTIFLTTQYLEEADELAGRVGVLDRGRIVAEGPPAQLKQRIGTDVVVADVDGDPEVARRAAAALGEVHQVSVHGSELTISVAHGAAALGPVAVALHGCGVGVRTLTLRTPTLDDVFLEVTGARLRDGDGVAPAPAASGPPASTPATAGTGAASTGDGTP